MLPTYRDDVTRTINKAKKDGKKYGIWIGSYNYRLKVPSFYLLDTVEEPLNATEIKQTYYIRTRYHIAACIPLELSLEEVSERMYEEYCRITANKIAILKQRRVNLENSLEKIHDAYLMNFD